MIKKVLISRQGQLFFVKDLKKDFHTQYGFLSKNDLGKKGVLRTNKDVEVLCISPEFIDLYKRITRHAQIITPKDIGLIISTTGVNKNSLVVDLGTGSGALACFLARIAKKVITYDIDKRSIKAAKENAKLLGLKNILIKEKNCYEGIDERNVDIITVDLPEPWRALESARKALKLGGFLVSYSPHITQSQRLVNAAKNDFIVLKTVELIEREWVIDDNRARPNFKGLGHTGFLTFLRRFN